jgi:hypothetical protein
MTRKSGFIPRVAAAGAIGNVLGLVQEGRGQGSVGAALQVDHVRKHRQRTDFVEIVYQRTKDGAKHTPIRKFLEENKDKPNDA